MRESDIAKLIERDILRVEAPKPDATMNECFMCGRGMMYRGNRFCSDRCRNYYDAGNPGHAQTWLHPRANYGLAGWKVIAGPPGVEIGSDYYAPLRAAFQARDPSYPRTPDGNVSMRPTKDGFMIACANCRKEFESRGRRCCCTECERRYKERIENETVAASVGIRLAPKRRCAQCGSFIPMWRNGRRVSRAARFCSDSCQKRAARAGKAA